MTKVGVFCCGAPVFACWEAELLELFCNRLGGGVAVCAKAQAVNKNKAPAARNFFIPFVPGNAYTPIVKTLNRYNEDASVQAVPAS